jgi:hypothetical protein
MIPTDFNGIIVVIENCILKVGPKSDFFNSVFELCTTIDVHFRAAVKPPTMTDLGAKYKDRYGELAGMSALRNQRTNVDILKNH